MQRLGEHHVAGRPDTILMSHQVEPVAALNHCGYVEFQREGVAGIKWTSFGANQFSGHAHEEEISECEVAVGETVVRKNGFETSVDDYVVRVQYREPGTLGGFDKLVE